MGTETTTTLGKRVAQEIRKIMLHYGGTRCAREGARYERYRQDRTVWLRAVERRVGQYDWNTIGSTLDAFGCAVLENLLTASKCQEIAALYPREECFRSHVRMARHGFGKGEYRYFKYPLPGLIGNLRTALYGRSHLRQCVERKDEFRLRYPSDHVDYLKICHEAGQVRPTSLLLQYGPGDYNCLHQDLLVISSSRCKPPSCCRNRTGLYWR